jgi:hypothetical protein
MKSSGAFQVSEFDRSYEVEIGPEFPGAGQWGIPVMNVDRDGHLTESIQTRWGPPLVIRVTPNVGYWQDRRRLVSRPSLERTCVGALERFPP